VRHLRDQAGSFLKNLTSLATANFAARVVGAAVSLLVINHLGEERYGAFATAMAFATVFLIFAETGVGHRLLYDRSGDKSSIDEHFGSALVLQVAPYLLVFAVAMAAAALLFGYSRLILGLIAIVSAAAVMRILAETCEKVINVYQEMHLTAMLRASRFVIIAAGGLVVVFADLGPVAWATVTLVAMTVSAAASLAVALRFARPRLVWALLWPTLKASYIFGLGMVFFAVYDKVDQVMLSKMMPAATAQATVGMYAAAYTLISFTYTLPGSFVASMEPVAYSARGEWARLGRLGNFSVRATGAVGLPLAAGTILFADEIKALLLPGYAEGTADALRVLAAFALLRFVNFPAGTFMAASGLQRRRVGTQGAATAFNLAANFLLIPVYGLVGAAAATVATEGLICISYTVQLRRRLSGYRGPLALAKPLAAAAAMAALILAAQRWALPPLAESRFWWLVVVPAAAGLYAAVLLLSGFLEPDEKERLKRLVRRLRPGGGRGTGGGE